MLQINGIEFAVVLWMLERIQNNAHNNKTSLAHQPARYGVQSGGIEGRLTQNLTGE